MIVKPLSFFLAAVSMFCLSSAQAEFEPVWAVNIGGEAFTGVDGTIYSADDCRCGGTVKKMPQVLGSQDVGLYLQYREGGIKLKRPFKNGRYDFTFHFAEPNGKAQKDSRVFDVIVNGQTVIDDLDVFLMRDGRPGSALTVTVSDVEVNDAELLIDFMASSGLPLLSALVVRNGVSRSDEWALIWRDEFEVDGPPDSGKWNLEDWPARVVNDEDQAYTSRSRNVRVEDGHLILEAHKEKFGHADYTSARVQSSGKGDFLYGRFEVKAKLPAGQGTWPAIWMLPSDPFKYATACDPDTGWQGNPNCDAWPNSGELDIMEHVGYQMNHIHGTVHTKSYYWVTWQQRKGRLLASDVDQNFHVYAMEWSPEKIDIFVDDALYFSYANEGEGWETWPFDHPFHLILNVAIGGMWGRAGGDIDDEIFPQRMVVDYVRAYRALP